jgi:hypothetical protein
MIIISRSAPNYEAAKRTYGIERGPIVVKAFADGPLANRINGLMNMGSCSSLKFGFDIDSK